MTSIKDIAALAGVAPSTVSRAVNGKGHLSASLRERILALVEETGYVPNGAARSMVLRRSFTIGVVIADDFNMFQRQLFSAIERRLEAYGYRTRFFFVKQEAGSESACLRALRAEPLDGVIMLHEIADPAFYAFLAGDGPPAVLCTFDKPGFGFASVHVDEEAAARAATEHLIGLGHRRIGLIAGERSSFEGSRRAGWAAALAAAGLEADEALVALVSAHSPEQGKAGMAELLSRGLGLDAVFAVTDELAIGAIRAIGEAGLRVPEEVSVIGFDDIDLGAELTPSLSTVRQPIAEMGAAAADLAYGLVAGGPPAGEPIVFPFALVARETTGQRPASAPGSTIVSRRA